MHQLHTGTEEDWLYDWTHTTGSEGSELKGVLRLIVALFRLPGQKSTGGLLGILPENSPFPHWKVTVLWHTHTPAPHGLFVSSELLTYKQCFYVINLSSWYGNDLGYPGKEENVPDVNNCFSVWCVFRLSVLGSPTYTNLGKQSYWSQGVAIVVAASGFVQ